MPIYRKAKEAGVFNPSDVALLGRVFDRLKIEGQSEQQREALASRIIANYSAGITDEDELVSVPNCRLGGELVMTARHAIEGAAGLGQILGQDL